MTWQTKWNNFCFFIACKVISWVLKLVILCNVLIKIKLYRKKCTTIIIPFIAQNQSKPLPSSLGIIFQTSLANLTTVAIKFLIIIPCCFLLWYLGTKDMQYLLHHKNLVYFHFHGIPLIIGTFSALNYFVNNKQMRETLFREIKTSFWNSN